MVDSVEMWHWIDMIREASSNEAITRIARQMIEQRSRFNDRQWRELIEVGKRRRKEFSGRWGLRAM